MNEKPIKALIVEDVFLIQRLIAHLIQDYAECKPAENGKDAINLFTSEYFNGVPFNLVCLDIYLPEMNGIEVLKSIRAFEEEIRLKEDERCKIVMVSSSSNHNMVNSAKKVGCDGYVTKPFTKNEVIAELLRLKLITEKQLAAEK